MTGPTQRLVYAAVVLAVAGVLVVGMVGAALIGRSAGTSGARAANSVLRDSLVAGCGRTQVQRAFLRVQNDGSLARALFQIVNCERTYGLTLNPNRSTVVFLPRRLDDCFVSLLRQGYWTTHTATTDPVDLKLLCNL